VRCLGRFQLCFLYDCCLCYFPGGFCPPCAIPTSFPCGFCERATKFPCAVCESPGQHAARIWPDSGQIRARTWPDLGRISAMGTQSRPILGRSCQYLARFWPDAADVWPGAGQDLARIRPDPGRMLAGKRTQSAPEFRRPLAETARKELVGIAQGRTASAKEIAQKSRSNRTEVTVCIAKGIARKSHTVHSETSPPTHIHRT